VNEEEYLKNRLDEQLAWYSKESKYNKICYKRLRLSEIVAAALIPLLSGAGDKITYNAWIIGVLGVLIAIAAAISSLSKFHENWIQYRTTLEQLKHEKYLFLTGVKPYNLEDKFPLLVERVEGLISKENSYWARSVKQVTKSDKKV
jgi:hypothetical protein